MSECVRKRRCRAATLLALLCATLVAAPALPKTLPANAVVSGLAADRVFISIGTAAGVQRGTRVSVRTRHGVVAGTLDAVASHSAAFPLPDAAARVKVGDAVFLRAEPAPGESESGPVVAVGPRAPQSELYEKALAPPAAPPPLVVAAVDRDRPTSPHREVEKRAAAWHGSLGLTGVVVYDGQPTGLDFYQVRLDSVLRGTDLAGGHLMYDHRLSVQGEFGTNLSSRPGSYARRWVRADWLNATYLPIAYGPYRITAGRMLPAAFALLGPVDGARFAWEGRHAGVGVTAGLAADPTNTYPSYRSLRAGLDAHVDGERRGLQMRADLAAHGALTDGSPDRAAVSLALSMRKRRWLDFYGYGEMGINPQSLQTVNRGTVSLDRLHAFLSVHAHKLLDVRVHYGLDRPVVDRFLALLVPAAYLNDSLRQVVGASARLRWDRLSVEPFGDIDLSQSSGFHYRFGGRIAVDRLPTVGSHLSAHAVYNDGAFTTTTSAGLRGAQQITDHVDVFAGYTFTLVNERNLQEKYALNTVEGGLGWLIRRRFHVAAEAVWEHGGFEEVVTAFGRLGFWF